MTQKVLTRKTFVSFVKTPRKLTQQIFLNDKFIKYKGIWGYGNNFFILLYIYIDFLWA